MCGYYEKFCFFFQAEDGIRDKLVTGVQTCALPIYLKQETHLPVLVDPSHAAGRRDLVPALALAAVAAGADGLLIEVHPDPDHARSDGDPSLRLDRVPGLMERMRGGGNAVGRQLAGSPGPLRRRERSA